MHSDGECVGHPVWILKTCIQMFKDSKGSKNYKDSKRILNIFGIFGIFGSFRVFEHSDKNGGGVAGSKPDGDGKCIGMRNALFVPFGFLKHAYKCLKTPEIPKVPKIPKNLRNPRDLWNVWHLWTFGNEWWGRCRIQTRWGWNPHPDCTALRKRDRLPSQNMHADA